MLPRGRDQDPRSNSRNRVLALLPPGTDIARTGMINTGYARYPHRVPRGEGIDQRSTRRGHLHSDDERPSSSCGAC